MIRLLLVDPDSHFRARLVPLLQAEGFDIVEAPGLTEARACTARTRFDLVLSELRLPDADGLRLAREMAEAPGRPVVVLLTAFGKVSDALAAIQSGATDLLPKSLNGPELGAALRTALERARVLGIADPEEGSGDAPPADRIEVPHLDPAGTYSLKQLLEEPERRIISEALRACGGNRERAAKLLGINRATLFAKLRKLGMKPPRASRSA